MKSDTEEIEIRTPEKHLLICTLAPARDGTMDVVSRRGKREDRMKVDDFIEKLNRHRHK